MKWCWILNMWCSDAEADDMEMVGCDGMCGDCDCCEEVTDNE